MRLTAFFLLFFIFACHGDSTKQIAALLSHDVEAYTQAWTEFRILLGRQHPNVVFLDFVIDSGNAAEVFAHVRSRKIDLLFAPGSDATRFAAAYAQKIPVVSLSLTPEAFRSENIAALPLEVPVRDKITRLHRILPAIRKIGVIYSSHSVSDYEQLSSTCSAQGLTVTGYRIKDPREFSAALNKMAKRMDCFVMVTDPSIYFHQSVDYLLREALVLRLPVVGLSSIYTKAGAAVSFECDYHELGRQAGEAACRILEGAKASSIEIKPPQTTRVSVNLSVAQRLGLSFTAGQMKQIDEVFGE